MNKTAIINNKTYVFIEQVQRIDSAEPIVICSDSEGNHLGCAIDVWQHSAPNTSAVTTDSTAKDKIALFMSLFRGRQDVFARRYHNLKTGQEGYAPVCANSWDRYLCRKPRRCADCPSKAFTPLSAEIIRSHLVGKDQYCRDVVGIYPILPDNTTYLLALDFDEDEWKIDVTAFREVCQSLTLVPAVERSRSGSGAHVWFFFTEPVTASDARRFGSGLLTRTMAQRHELNFKSYDRMFPSQDTLPKGGFGNLIALPFQGQAQKNGNSLFIDENYEPYQDQWAFLSTVPRITSAQLEEYLSELCTDSDLGQLGDGNDKSDLSGKDFPKLTKIVLSNLIYIQKEGFSQKALNRIKRIAAFRNPAYYKAQAMRMPTYNIPRIIDCGEEDKNLLALPRGCVDSLKELFDANGANYYISDERNEGRSIDVCFDGKLRSEQEPAAQALLGNEIGVLSATTAFGKTVIGAYLIGQRKVNTLILVHSSALLEQWKTSLETFLTINEELPQPPKKRGRRKQQSKIGQLGAGKNTINGIVDIAIMQSMFEGDEKAVKPFASEYGMVICDECHHIAAFSFEKVLKSVKAKYIYGLSATPTRQDGHQPIIFMQCGPIRYTVDAKEQSEKRSFDHFVIPRFTNTRLPDAYSVQSTYNALTTNEPRNCRIIEDTLKQLSSGRTPIILTQRREHAELLADMLSEHCKNTFLLLGSDKQKLKREKLESIKAVPAEEQMAVVSTGKYVGEGFDEPRLDTLLLAMPVSWKGTLAQYVGRLHRNYDGKTEVRVYDYADIHVPMLERMYQKRLKGYLGLGYSIKADESDIQPGIVYTGQDYYDVFRRDIESASGSICISSPYIKLNRAKTILSIVPDNVPLSVITKPVNEYSPDQRSNAEESIKMLENAGVKVIFKPECTQRFAVIDNSIVWYGSIDYLSYSKHDADVIRFESSDVAGELTG